MTEQVVVIGGGPVAINAANRELPHAPVKIIALNLGAAVAYGTNNRVLLANVPCNQVTAHIDDVNHFLNWRRGKNPDIAENDFPTRCDIGEYFNGEGVKLAAQPDCTHIKSFAEDIRQDNGKWLISHQQGESYSTRVILTLGHPAVDDPAPVGIQNYWSNPYFHSPEDRQDLRTQLQNLSAQKQGEPVEVILVGQGAGTLDAVLNIEAAIEGTPVRVHYTVVSRAAEMALWWPYEPDRYSDGRTYETHYLTQQIAKCGPLGNEWHHLMESELAYADENGFAPGHVYCKPQLLHELAAHVPEDAQPAFEQFSALFNRRYGGVCNPYAYEVVTCLHQQGKLKFVDGYGDLANIHNGENGVVLPLQGAAGITSDIVIRTAPYAQGWLDADGTPRNPLLRKIYAKGLCSFDKSGHLCVTDEYQLVGLDGNPVQGLFAAGPAVGPDSKWGLETFQRQLAKIPLPQSPPNKLQSNTTMGVHR